MCNGRYSNTHNIFVQSHIDIIEGSCSRTGPNQAALIRDELLSNCPKLQVEGELEAEKTNDIDAQLELYTIDETPNTAS